MKEKSWRDFDLESRLIDFAVRVIRVVEALPPSMAGKHLGSQLIRSGTSPAANYGEAQSAESRPDFIHKLKISLKELRETRIWLEIGARSGMIESEKIASLLDENEQLISILVASINTARNNHKKSPRPPHS